MHTAVLMVCMLIFKLFFINLQRIRILGVKWDYILRKKKFNTLSMPIAFNLKNLTSIKKIWESPHYHGQLTPSLVTINKN